MEFTQFRSVIDHLNSILGLDNKEEFLQSNMDLGQHLNYIAGYKQMFALISKIIKLEEGISFELPSFENKFLIKYSDFRNEQIPLYRINDTQYFEAAPSFADILIIEIAYHLTQEYKYSKLISGNVFRISRSLSDNNFLCIRETNYPHTLYIKNNLAAFALLLNYTDSIKFIGQDNQSIDFLCDLLGTSNKNIENISSKKWNILENEMLEGEVLKGTYQFKGIGTLQICLDTEKNKKIKSKKDYIELFNKYLNFIGLITTTTIEQTKIQLTKEILEAAYSQSSSSYSKDEYNNLINDLKLNSIGLYGESDITLYFLAPKNFEKQQIIVYVDDMLNIQECMIQ